MRGMAHLRRNRRVILLFALMVLLPAAIFGILIVRTVRSERMQVAQQNAERQRQIVRLVERDLNAWLFSTQPEAAISEALVRFHLDGDHIVFPELHLTLPAAGSPPRPSTPPPPGDRPTARVITDFYYPRILTFLRDFKSGAQYFLRLRAVVVLLPGRDQGYVLDARNVLDHVNQRLAEFCAAANCRAALWIGDLRDNTSQTATAAFGLEGFSFFQVRLSRLRTDFVSAVSHEFRSPLSSILALSERLESSRVHDAAKLDQYRQVIGQEARRLSALVTRLLDFAQIEEGKKVYSFERVELVGLAREALQSCHYSVRQERIRLCGEDAAPLWVRADRTALRHYRGRQASELDVQGVGIGLALVRHVMEGHGGSV